MKELVEKALAGDHISIGRVITIVEGGGKEGIELLRELYPFTGKAYYLGITGAPGVGKSTLVDKLIYHLRGKDKKIGVIAIDPTSPFTGGAFLGDRLRMQRHATDPGVFIRSMGSRGALGGLSKATADVAKVLDACGFDYIIIETVGAGQNEVDIVKTADTVILVLVPGMGDEIQVIKAGIMEIGDIFVVNKSDKDGADRLARELKVWLEFGYKESEWVPPVIMTIAEDGTGVDKLVEEIERHQSYLRNSGKFLERRKTRVESELKVALEEKIRKQVENLLEEEILRRYVERILAKEIDPYTLVDEVIRKVMKGG